MRHNCLMTRAEAAPHAPKQLTYLDRIKQIKQTEGVERIIEKWSLGGDIMFAREESNHPYCLEFSGVNTGVQGLLGMPDSVWTVDMKKNAKLWQEGRANPQWLEDI